MSASTPKDDSGISGPLIFFGSWGVAAIVALAELAVWLQTAAWPHWFSDAVFRYGPVELTQWLLFPYSWLGLHKIVAALVAMPLSCAVLAFGLIVGGLMTAFDR